MILGAITTIVSILGIIGFYINNFILLYLGLFSAIIEHSIGIYTGEEKSLITVWFALLIALGFIFSGMNWLKAIAICLCFENVLCFILGSILMIFMVRKNTNK